MRYQKLLGLSILGRSTLFVGLLCISFLTVSAKECGESKEITSNQIRVTAGNGDTLWMFTARGLNYTLDLGATWWGHTPCGDARFYDLAFGNAQSLAWSHSSQNDQVVFWNYIHSKSVVDSFTILIPDTLKYDSLKNENFNTDLGGVVHSGDNFWVAFNDRGLLRLETRTSNRSLFIPGVHGSISTNSTLVPANLADTLTKRVLSVDPFNEQGDTLLVVTPTKLWKLTLPDSSWDSSFFRSTLEDPLLHFKSFESTVWLQKGDSPLLGAFIDFNKNGSDADTSFFLYNFAKRSWSRVSKQAPRWITRSAGGQIYTITSSNQIWLMRPDSSGVDLQVVVNQTEFARRITASGLIEMPDSLISVTYVPIDDSTGHLWIASSDGLFLSKNEQPGKSTGPFEQIKNSPKLLSGLGKTYAAPGVIRADPSGRWSKTTFVYNLYKNSRVTIKVYDYNMDLVVTVVDNQERQAGINTASGRSTDTRYDKWDGTYSSGKTVAPGVYYYKITTSTGERSFGKIVVAK